MIWRKAQIGPFPSLRGATSRGAGGILLAMRCAGKHPCDPRNLIHEAFRIEDIGVAECRAIFFDWAIGLDSRIDVAEAARRLHEDLAPAYPEHPMTALLAEAAYGITPERGQARGRRRRSS